MSGRGRSGLPVRALFLAGCALFALAVAGCGTQTREPTTKPATNVASTSAPQAVTILTPVHGSTVHGRHVRSGAVTASVTVTGHADELQTVRVDGACPARTCSRIIYTGPDGQWTARLRLVLPARARRVTVTADYAVTPDPATRARLTVPVRAVAARAPAHHRSASPASNSGASTTPNEPQQTNGQTTPVAPSSPARSGPRGLVLVGDSLAVGVRALLPAALPGWSVEVLGRVGRPLAEGMGVLAGLGAFSSSQDARPVLAVSLFTNDDPTHTSALEAAVRQTLGVVGTRGCVIWATIARPPVNGVTYRAANALLERLARSDPRLHVVPWAQEVAANPALLGADAVHPTPAGYELRAQLYAQAAQAC
jgi:hypothetical protein